MTSLKAKLAKAKARLFGTAARDVPVPFELPCDCGHRVTGIRRSSFQIATCSACQTDIYVLPVNVYPGTRRVRSEVIDGPVAARVGTIVRELVVGEKTTEDKKRDPESRTASQKRASEKSVPEQDQDDDKRSPDKRLPEEQGDDGRTEGERAGNRRRRSKTGRSSSPSQEAQAEPIVTEPETGAPLVLLPRISVADRLKRAFSPTRLLALAGVGILVATGWWMIRQRQMDEARRVWRHEMDVVAVALKEHDLPALQSALKKAVDAAIVLNRSDAESRDAESLLLQTEATQDLSSADLVSLLSGFTKADGSFDSAKAREVSESLKGERFVFEAPLVTRSGGDRIPVLDFPLIVDGRPLRISVPSRLLEKCAEAEPLMPLLFVAKIRTCLPPSDSAGEWQMSLDPASCTLITTEFHAKEVGLDLTNSPQLSQTLERQAAFIKSTTLPLTESLVVTDREVKP